MIRPEDIRPCPPLLPAPLEALDQDVLDAWCDELFDEARAALDAEATPDAFRDDGTLYHGRLPSEDVDAFNPWIVARAERLRPQILPAPVSIYPGMLLRVRSEVL